MGMFSWDCIECRHPAFMPGCTETENAWMSQIVVQFNNGDQLSGEYDGYGRVGCTDFVDSGEPCLRHRACWEAVGRPGFAGESESSANQGFGESDGRHSKPEPKTAGDVAAIRVPDDYVSPEQLFWQAKAAAEQKALEQSPTCECGAPATCAHNYHNLESRTKKRTEEEYAAYAHDPKTYRTACDKCKGETWKVWKADYDKVQARYQAMGRGADRLRHKLELSRIEQIHTNSHEGFAVTWTPRGDETGRKHEAFPTFRALMQALRDGLGRFSYTKAEQQKAEDDYQRWLTEDRIAGF